MFLRNVSSPRWLNTGPWQLLSRIQSYSTLLHIPAILLLSLSIASANTRLAIGTFGLTPENRDGDLAGLIEARLSMASGIDLVERRELDKALAETGLSLSGLVKGKDAAHVGTLLRAGQFLVATSVSVNGTNRLFVRLLDGRTGAIRSINVFADSGSLDELAQNICEFVRAEISRPPQDHRDYLAIGIVQNLGVNDRFAGFPAQMRGYVAAKLSGRVTLLERDVISLLADEVRMEMAGLTQHEGQKANIQFGFWIVDGYYQSYEVAEPEVQLRLRVERVQGGQQSFLLQGRPDESFFTKICDSVSQAISNPASTNSSVPPTHQGEIAALEARGAQLVDYYPPMHIPFGAPVMHLRSAQTPEKVKNTLDEATRVYESILLLDPDNNAAKMRLASCLLCDFDYMEHVNLTSDKERIARAMDLYRQVISTSDPEYADAARLLLAKACDSLEGVEMLRRFASEAPLKNTKKYFHDRAREMLQVLEPHLPLETVLPHVRNEILDELGEARENAGQGVNVSFDDAFLMYRFKPEVEEKIINTILPDLLEKFPDLKPYILLAAAAEQTTTNSPVIAQFLASLADCEAHPETVLQPSSYFAHLSSTLEEEKQVRQCGGHTLCQKMFENHQYALIIRLSLARKKAAEKGLAPPLTDNGKEFLAKSHMALQQWQEALNLFTELPGIDPQVKNECRNHLGVAPESEAVSDAEWKGQTDIEKVNTAYKCMERQQWSTAEAILESMGHRTIRMNCSGPWGFAFTPVLPAVVADQCRAKQGRPPAADPMRFEISEPPYFYYKHDGRSREFPIEVEDGSVWIAASSQIGRFGEPGLVPPVHPAELHNFPRTTNSSTTCICVSPGFVWAGTLCDGLMELDRNSGVCRRLTMKDGLALNGISALHLQGQTLWIAYTNGQNGAIGTLDLKSRKFSTLTPMLRDDAGAASESSYHQARLDNTNDPPQLPVVAMTEGEEGDMWFAVYDKGLQHFRSSGGGWSTPWHVREQTAFFSDIAVDTTHGQVLTTMREINYLENEKSRTGGLDIYDYRQNRHEVLQIAQGLPSNDLTAVAVDGRIAWVGGRGFVAVLDIQQRKVLRVAYLPTSGIPKIQLDKACAWIQVACGERDYGYGTRFSGTAWNGVYRVERAAVEPSELRVASKR